MSDKVGGNGLPDGMLWLHEANELASRPVNFEHEDADPFIPGPDDPIDVPVENSVLLSLAQIMLEREDFEWDCVDPYEAAEIFVEEYRDAHGCPPPEPAEEYFFIDETRPFPPLDGR